MSRTVSKLYFAVLFVAQLFGVFPVAGVLQPHVRQLRYRRLHWTHVPFVFIIIDSFIELALSARKNLSNGLKLNASAEVVFIAVSLGANLLLYRIARHWPAIATEWHRADAIFRAPPYVEHAGRLTLGRRVRLVAFGMLGAAMVEHSLYIASALHKNRRQIDDCQLTVEFFANLFGTERSHVFQYVPYSHWLAVPSEYCNVAMTFCWTFADVFVAALSVALSTRFDQYNRRLLAARGRPMSEAFWWSMRTDYNRLAELVVFVDRRVSSLVVLSCLSNLYFVCFLLFNSIK